MRRTQTSESMSMSFRPKLLSLVCSAHKRIETKHITNRHQHTRALKQERQRFPRVLRSERDNVIVAGNLEDLGHGRQRQSQRQAAVSSIVVEGFGAEKHGDQRNVRRVHGLQRNADRVAIQIGLVLVIRKKDMIHIIMDTTTNSPRDP